MNPVTDGTVQLTDRAIEIRDAARELLEREGPEGLVIRRLCDRVGVRAPAIYRRFPDKRAIENSIVSQVLREVGDIGLRAVEGADDPIIGLACAYRAWALEHPHLYRLTFGNPLSCGIDPEAERYSGTALRDATDGDLDAARALWAFFHGMVSLELDGRFPSGSDLDAIWHFGLEGIRRQFAR
jgi:AcrR family transcriptional regulator